MTRALLPISGYTINPAAEITTQVVGVVEFLQISIPTMTLYLTSGNQPYTFGGNTYTPVSISGTPYGAIQNYNEGLDSVARPMVLTISGCDQTLIDAVVSNDCEWTSIIWSIGLLDANNNLVNSTPMMVCPLFFGDCTIVLGQNSGSISINAENLLADLQNRQSGCLQTVADQQARGISGNTTFKVDTFYEYAASLTWTFVYWGMTGPSNLGIYGGAAPKDGMYGQLGNPSGQKMAV